MLDFSFFELLLVSLITLIVVGPDRLPAVARTIGFWVGRGRAVVTSLRSEFEREVNATGIQETEKHLREEFTQADRELRNATRVDGPAPDAASGSRSPNDAEDEPTTAPETGNTAASGDAAPQASTRSESDPP